MTRWRTESLLVLVALVVALLASSAAAQNSPAPPRADGLPEWLAPIVSRRMAIIKHSATQHLQLIHELEDRGWLTTEGQTPAPTGDALFDQYAAAVHERINAVGPKLPGDSIEWDAALPQEVLLEWLPEFEDDPRMWELLYLNALLDGDPGPLEGPGVYPMDYLREARRRRVARPATLLLLYIELESRQEAEADRLWDELSSNGTVVMALPVEKRQQLLDLQAEHEAELDALLAEITDGWPHYAWGHYFQASRDFVYGRTTEGRAALRQGNSAPSLEPPLPFPFSHVISQLQANAVPGSLEVSGAILTGLGSCPGDISRQLASRERDVELMLNLGADAELLKEWYSMACRYITAYSFRPQQASAGMTMLRRQVYYLEDTQAVVLSSHQLEQLQRVRGSLDTASGKLSTELARLSYISEGAATADSATRYLGTLLKVQQELGLGRRILEPLATLLGNVDLFAASPHPGLAAYPLVPLPDER